MPIAIAISLSLVLATVFSHYEGLRLVSRGLLVSHATQGRRKVLLAVLWIFLIHIVEINLYAFGYWFADLVVNIGSFTGAREAKLFDYFYFSAEAFSTLGLGDIYPIGPLRLLASIEPINGLLLIGWSTSFTFLAMQRFWFNGEMAGDADGPLAAPKVAGQPAKPASVPVREMPITSGPSPERAERARRMRSPRFAADRSRQSFVPCPPAFPGA
jgi:hypothetical protein